ncbi:hypothetical protein TRFO_21282 [Tritrichomonas foetus]|uniref:Uncharacterized protein n=1 Tax=Tritrichomonas foetus TaxID=1144522 RepID=A0A1J4KFF1_9EUKA|nr:hypothetical protein TRFO_21282 [Tritrichomonas foetus]|eukprot:OHT09754.1 hypothetical protein TRFO_21282 [Tritrichomonas foetus]
MNLETERHYKISERSYIYRKRVDILKLKQQLFEIVDENEYIPLVTTFFHKKLSKEDFDERIYRILVTEEAKNLHNQIIRGIIYNAHYSTIPPPNVTIPKTNPTPPKPKAPPHIGKMKNLDFHTYMAADLRHLQSIFQMHERIMFILYIKSHKLKVDPNAVQIVQQKLISYILNLLRESLKFANPVNTYKESPNILPQHIMHIYNSMNLFSPEIITKYTSMLS